jgi:hypothetical protein
MRIAPLPNITKLSLKDRLTHCRDKTTSNADREIPPPNYVFSTQINNYIPQGQIICLQGENLCLKEHNCALENHWNLNNPSKVPRCQSRKLTSMLNKIIFIAYH